VPGAVIATGSACNATAQAAIFATIVGAATSATTSYGGAQSCVAPPASAATARRALLALSVGASVPTCSSNYFLSTFTTQVIIPQGGSYGAAVSALNALPSSAFAAAVAAIAASAGCPASSVTMSTVYITAACGGGSANVTCSIPGAPPGYTTNVDAIIGGVIGGALLFIIFVSLVLACRGYCGCCAAAGCCCPRRKASPFTGGDASVAAGVTPARDATWRR
jgi:hypothetical protein